MKYILLTFLLAFALTANSATKAPVQNNITAKSFLVVDDHGQELLAKNADHVQPIASITKLMTALVVLDSHQNLDEDLELNFKLAGRYHTKLPRNLKTLTRRELLDLAIVKSDNFAAYTLCQHHWGGVSRCVADMNHMAVELKMINTRFADPTGLDPNNVSNARDLVKLVLAASEHTEITEASGKPKVSIQVKRRWWDFGNTNPLVRRGDNIKVSKTGYIGASGGCIVMLLDTEVGERIVVLLNSKNTRTRIPEAAKIAVTVSHSDVSVD
jgi:D-alanyl-D-alanine endopeptidase (penicillin-binding protein 7)